jgi:hypothetical protein
MIFHLFIQHFQEGYSPFIRSFYVYNEEGATAMKSEAYDSVKGPRGPCGISCAGCDLGNKKAAEAA